MTSLGSTAAVIATMRDDAAAEIETIEREADAAIATLDVAVASAPDPERQRQVDGARQAALDAEAQDARSDARTALTDREAWIAEVVAEAERTLADSSNVSDVREWIAALVREALPHVPGADCVVSVPAAWMAFLDEDWRARLQHETGRTFTVVGDGPPAGCIVRTADGRVMFDNSVAARTRRSMHEWRPALARIYAEAVERRPATVEAAQTAGSVTA